MHGATLATIAQKLLDLAPDARVLGFNYDTGERYLSVWTFCRSEIIHDQNSASRSAPDCEFREPPKRLQKLNECRTSVAFVPVTFYRWQPCKRHCENLSRGTQR